MNDSTSGTNRNGTSASGTSASDLSGLVAFRASVYDGSGYADEARGIVLGLYRAGVRVHLEPFGLQYDAQNLLSAEEREIFEMLKHQSIDMGRGAYFQHCPAHDFNVFMRCRHLVGRTMYETDSIPDGWRDYCEAMDEVWVPSTFNCETFASGGVTRERLHALPGGIDTDLFHPDAEPFALPQRRGFNFLSVFEWIDRKGADILLQAYLKEFRADEDVALILKTYGRPEAHADMLPRLAYIDRAATRTAARRHATGGAANPGFSTGRGDPEAVRSADAFVLPTRGEGWGRPFMEALACGLPVIATCWSGHLDFLREEICYFADNELRPVPWNNDVELSAGHQWAEVSVEHLRKLMRRVFENREEAKQKGLSGRAEMVGGWQWGSVIQKYWIPQLERLLS